MTSRTAQKKQQPSKGKQGKGRPTNRRPPTAKQRKAQRRSHTPMIAIGAVVAIVLVMIGLSVANHARTVSTPGGAGAAKVIAAVTSVPAATLDAAGAGEGVSPPTPIGAGAPEVTSDGKPQVLYIGAEYCPYCAAQRWPLIVALSRFGAFSGLGLTTSSASDVFPSTPTLTFHGSSFASDAISFSGVEANTNQPDASGTGYEPLDTPTPEQQQLLQTYDGPPYTSPAGSIPFLLIGNRYVISGSSYHPDVLQGKTWQQISKALSDPSSPVAQHVLGTANMLTAAICELTGGQPSDVCTAPGVTSAAGALPAA